MTPVRVDPLDLRERLVTLKEAYPLVPFVSMKAMRNFLDRHPEDFPSRWMPMGRRYVRMITLTEVAIVRQMRLSAGSLKQQHARRVADLRRRGENVVKG
jgi:hypothetical protein